MWVATNRQKPPEKNAFAKRAQMRREEVTPPVAAPAEVPAPRDPITADALLAAASSQTNSSDEPVSAPEPDEAPKTKPGRAKSQATLDREAAVLAYVTDAQQVGVTKAGVVAFVGGTPAQIYAALKQLEADGHVESREVPDSKAHRWFVV